MPLLNYQQMTDFLVQVWDSETRTYVCDLKSLNRGLGLHEENSQNDINWTKALEWDTDGDTKMFEQFIQATKNSPFLLLIQG